MSKIVNILFSDCDFSYSVFESNEPVLIPNKNYEVIGYHPFAISYCKNDKWLFGSAAIEYSRHNYGSTVFSIYDVLDEYKKLELNGETFDPLIILVKLFQQIDISVRDYLGQTSAYTISLPNESDLFQKQFIEKVAYTASIPLRRVYKYTDCLAATYCYSNPTEGETICCIYLDKNSIHIGVYDIGDGIVESKSTTSSKRFNNKLLADQLLLYCLSVYKNKGYQSYNVDFNYLKTRCESALREVFNGKTVSIFVSDTTDSQKSIYIELTAEKVQSILKEQFDELYAQIDETLNDNGYNLIKYIEKVLIDTGNFFNTYLPNVLKKKFNCPIIESNQYVRRGGATYSGSLEGYNRDILLLESISEDIYILLKNGQKTKLIGKHTTIPTNRSEYFNVKPKNKQIEIPLFSNDKFIGGPVISLNSTEEDRNYEVQITIDIDVNSKITLETTVVGIETKTDKIELRPLNFSILKSAYITSELELL